MGSTYEDFYHNACRERDDLRAEVELAQSESRKARKRTAELAAEVERLQAELVELRALADKRTRDEDYGWCEREGECWLMDGPCAGHRRGKESPLLRDIEYDDARLAEQEENQ